jgi:hypothetical protein
LCNKISDKQIKIMKKGKELVGGKRNLRNPEEIVDEVEVVAAMESSTEASSQIDLNQITMIIQTALGPLVNKVQELEKQLGSSSRTGGPEVSGNSMARNVLQFVELLPTQDRPTFSGGTQNPITFLEDLKDYINRTKRVDELMVIKESLRGNAKSWLKLYNRRWKNIADFEKDFLANYWGDICQKMMRRKLSDAVWDPKSGINMSAHFATYWELAKALKITDSPLGVVNEIIRHYPKETQALWFSRDQGDELDAAEFLRKMDNMVYVPQEINNRKRDRVEHEDERRVRERRQDMRARVNAIEGVNRETQCHSCQRPRDTTLEHEDEIMDVSGEDLCIMERAENGTGAIQEP